MKKVTKYLYLFTLVYFIFGIININLSWLALICFITPFYLVFKYKQKVWCQTYCPRASTLTFFLSKKVKKIKTDKFLNKKEVKNYVLTYFAINLFFIIMSTIMVAKGRIYPIEKVRFLIFFQIPLDLPQLIELTHIPSWVSHLSYRFYSMMFTSTLIGLFLGYQYRARTWCIICPVNTLSDIKLRRTKHATETTN